MVAGPATIQQLQRGLAAEFMSQLTPVQLTALAIEKFRSGGSFLPDTSSLKVPTPKVAEVVEYK